jgi:hypothetical protein
MTKVAKQTSHERFDARDRLIIALYAQLRAERETREAMEWVIRNGGLSPEVLEAMASDPIPVVTADDIKTVENSLKRLQLNHGSVHP